CVKQLELPSTGGGHHSRCVAANGICFLTCLPTVLHSQRPHHGWPLAPVLDTGHGDDDVHPLAAVGRLARWWPAVPVSGRSSPCGHPGERWVRCELPASRASSLRRGPVTGGRLTSL